MAQEDQLREKIQELIQEIQKKDLEIMRYRAELARASDLLEKLIHQSSKELLSAQQLQRMLSPTELPNIQGFDFSTKFNPGSRFGGDYFDIFEHEDKLKFGMLISSASGYGLSSILLSAIIKLSSQIEARRGLKPDKVLEVIAKDVTPQIKNNDEASLFYAVVDRRTFEMEYSHLGSIRAYVQVSGKDSLTDLASNLPGLKKDSKIEMTSKLVQLNSRDRLIFATEGVTGVKSASGDVWGESGLISAIRQAPKAGVHELRNEILYQAEKYSGKTTPERDQTLVVAEVKDKVIKLARRD